MSSLQNPNNNRGLVYLAGPIEWAEDYGKGWRDVADKALRGLGYRVYNPSSDEQSILEPFGLKSSEEFLKLKKGPATFSRFREIMKGIIKYDLAKLEESDAVLVYLDRTLSGGTAGEVTVARWLMNKPVYAIVKPEDLPLISGWVGACLTHIFKDIDTGLDYIKKYGF